MSIEEVRTLVAERQRYDDWLTALEAKRADTPPRVYERVHGDYLGRRSEVIARLQSHVGPLSQIGSDLESRLHELETRLAGHEEELAEGMLRNLVGEFDGERWDSVRQDVEAKIEALGHERAALAIEVEDVRALLGSARAEPEADIAESPEAEEPAAVIASGDENPQSEERAATPQFVASHVDDDQPEPIASVGVPTPVVPTSAVPTPVVPSQAFVDYAMSADELDDTAEIAVPLAFASTDVPAASDAQDHDAPSDDRTSADDDSLLDFDASGIVENPVPQGARHEDVLADVAALFDTSSITSIPEPEGQGTMSSPSNAAEFDDALAMFGESTSEADAQFLKSLEGIEADHETPRAGARPDANTATATPPSAGNAGDPFDDLAFLRSVTGTPGAGVPAPAAPTSGASSSGSAEPQKTLRCTECGTMNLPTEWYCERCGGELAAF